MVKGECAKGESESLPECPVYAVIVVKDSAVTNQIDVQWTQQPYLYLIGTLHAQP